MFRLQQCCPKRRIERHTLIFPMLNTLTTAKECTFDYLIKKHNITDPAVLAMAPIITWGRIPIAMRLPYRLPACGLFRQGLAYNFKNDHELLEKGMLIYDAL